MGTCHRLSWPRNKNSPERCGWLSPAHPPGATQKVERSTTGRSSGVSLRLDLLHRPSLSPEGVSAGDARFRPVDRANPTLLPSTATIGRTRRRLPPRLLRPVARPPSPEWKPGLSGEPDSVAASAPDRFPDHGAAPTRLAGEPASVAGDPRPRCPLTRTPLPELDPRWPGEPGPVGSIDAVHADPVNRAIAVAPSEPLPYGELGSPFDVGSVPRPVHSPVARRMVGSKLWLLAPFRVRCAS